MTTARVGDLDLYYEEHGSGDPLLLIMGFAADSMAWLLQVPDVRRSTTGRSSSTTAASDGARSRRDRTPSTEMADDAAGLLDALHRRARTSSASRWAG